MAGVETITSVNGPADRECYDPRRPHSAMESRRTLVVPGSLDGVRRAAAALDEFSREALLPAGDLWPFQVTLDEVLSNVVRHGYGADAPSSREIEVQFGLKDGVLELVIQDDAAPFDPLAEAPPDTASLERPPGGLGIFLVRRLMDEVAYERREGRNRLVCRRSVGGGAWT